MLILRGLQSKHTCGDVDGLVLGDVSDDQLVPAGILLHHAKLNCPIEQKRDLRTPGVGLQPVGQIISVYVGALQSEAG